jgi:8-oxo-dGTP diphosphatase
MEATASQRTSYTAYSRSRDDPAQVCAPLQVTPQWTRTMTVPITSTTKSAMRADSATPSVEIRLATLTFVQGQLLAFVSTGAQRPHLPSRPAIVGESLDESAKNLVRDSLGFPEQYMEQLYSLSHDDDGQWTIIISYLALVCSEGEPTSIPGGMWIDARETYGLAEGDRKVMEYAVFRLRAKLGYTTIAFHLMPDLFTLSELQSVFETILGRPLDKRNFRRRMATLGILSGTRQTRRDGSHRPARLYRFRRDRDPTDYLTPPWASSQPGERAS